MENVAFPLPCLITKGHQLCVYTWKFQRRPIFWQLAQNGQLSGPWIKSVEIGNMRNKRILTEPGFAWY